MKTTLLVATLAALTAVRAGAQDHTLAGDNGRLGGFGGPTLTFTRIASSDAVFAGARGGFIINGTVAMGVSLAGWHDDLVRGSDGLQHQVSLGYGGFDLEYIDHTHSVAHFTVHLTIGGGSATQDEDHSFFDGDSREKTFFLAEPGVGVEVNVLKFFRVNLGATYRYVHAVNLPAFNDDDFRGLSGRLTFKLGRF